MNRSKKLFSFLLALALCSSFLSTSAEACEGQTTYSCGTADMASLINQFNENCCSGSSITIIDVCEGAISKFIEPNLQLSGYNSSCEPELN